MATSARQKLPGQYLYLDSGKAEARARTLRAQGKTVEVYPLFSACYKPKDIDDWKGREEDGESPTIFRGLTVAVVVGETASTAEPVAAASVKPKATIAGSKKQANGD